MSVAMLLLAVLALAIGFVGMVLAYLAHDRIDKMEKTVGELAEDLLKRRIREMQKTADRLSFNR